jgi:hypothetical protein
MSRGRGVGLVFFLVRFVFISGSAELNIRWIYVGMRKRGGFQVLAGRREGKATRPRKEGEFGFGR